MASRLQEKIVKTTHKKDKNELVPEILKRFNLATNKKNQFLAFFKPESFFEKTPAQSLKLVELAFNKFKDFDVQINGVAIFPGPSLSKFSIMDKHYGVINKLSKEASKVLTKADTEAIFKALGIKDRKIKILGGHEAYDFFGFSNTSEFDQIWNAESTTKIRSGFYVRPLILKNEKIIVVNGFHPHQLAHYTDKGKNLAVFLISTNSDWKLIREDMLGDSYPEKAKKGSIRGEVFKNAKKYGFDKVAISNNIMHVSAGPTEFLFEAQNFLKLPFGIDIHKEARLSRELKKLGLTKKKIEEIITSQEIHSQLEHKNTDEAIELIRSLV